MPVIATGSVTPLSVSSPSTIELVAATAIAVGVERELRMALGVEEVRGEQVPGEVRLGDA